MRERKRERGERDEEYKKGMRGAGPGKKKASPKTREGWQPGLW